MVFRFFVVLCLFFSTFELCAEEEYFNFAGGLSSPDGSPMVGIQQMDPKAVCKTHFIFGIQYSSNL